MTQLYLTLLTLNPRSREARRDAASTYEFHCTLRTRLFANSPKESAGRVLFRLERDPDIGISKVLIQSHNEPNIAALPPNYWLGVPEIRSDYAEKLQAIAAGQYLRFRLLANPTVKRKNSDGKPARYGLYKEIEHREWLVRKLADGGAKIIDFKANHPTLQNFMTHNGGDIGQTHLAVRFDGILQVIDSNKLCRVVGTGIGSAKGFGFGLLSLAPAG